LGKLTSRAARHSPVARKPRSALHLQRGLAELAGNR
jgi:hypothetical protein